MLHFEDAYLAFKCTGRPPATTAKYFDAERQSMTEFKVHILYFVLGRLCNKLIPPTLTSFFP